MPGLGRKISSEISTGSMADIAFLLLIFFLVTTTMDIDTGLLRRLPPMPPEDIPPDSIKVKDRNVFVVLINRYDQLQVEGKNEQIENLREKTKEFIKGDCGNEEMPECRDTILPLLGPVKVSKQIISLQNDNATSYDIYVQVQNELIAAYNELRDELAEQKFGKKYLLLSEPQREEIRTIYPQRISEAEPKETVAQTGTIP